MRYSRIQSYVIAGFVRNAYVPLLIGIVLVLGALFIVKYVSKEKEG